MLSERKSPKSISSSLCLIPARKGSKGLQGKNVKPIGGKPMISWTIECALESGIFERIMVSTNDEQVKDIARQYRVSILDRPDQLASDTSLASEYLRYHEETILKFKFLYLLQPTSPLREIVDIFAAQELLLRFEKEEVCVISMNETELRLRNLFLIDKFGLASRISSGIEKNRQDDVSIYSMNGAIFAAKSLYLRSINYNFVAGNVIPLVMPKNRSIDVDDLNDFENAISLIEKKIR